MRKALERSMIVAFVLDFQGAISRREGIMTYVGYLLNGILEYDDKITIEIWLYSDNIHSFENDYSDILVKYGSRVKVFDETLRKNYSKGKYKHKIKSILYEKISKMLYSLGFHTLGDVFYNKIELHKRIFDRSTCDLAKAVNDVSKADCVFVPFPGLTEALRINKPIVMQIHDLFTIPLIELFTKETFPRANYIKQNRLISGILKSYAKKGTYFVCSSKYTRDSQILKYIKGTDINHCRVISFPPMYTEHKMEDIISEREFRDKFGINGKYIAFPSQNRANKNLITLLKAIKTLQSEGIDIVLVTTGKMADCNSTRKYAALYPELVIEVGNLTEIELVSLYKYSTLVVCPNIIEGMGISGQGLEAISAGKPVVHGLSLGIKESLENVGLNLDSAMLNWVECDDYIEMASKIKYVMQNIDAVVENQKNVLVAYNKKTWNEVGHNYIDLFKEITR